MESYKKQLRSMRGSRSEAKLDKEYLEKSLEKSLFCVFQETFLVRLTAHVFSRYKSWIHLIEGKSKPAIRAFIWRFYDLTTACQLHFNDWNGNVSSGTLWSVLSSAFLSYWRNIGSFFHDKAPRGHTWGGGIMVEVAKWQSGKVSGFCHLDFASSLF